MTTDIRSDVEREMQGRSDTFLERFADRLGAKAGTNAAFTDPVERAGVTVIGVAKVRWGLGGGGGTGGSKDRGEGSGSGGGGGVLVSPTGYIEIKDGSAEYKPIRPQGMEMAIGFALMSLAGAIAIGILLGGVRGLIRD